MRPFTPEVHSYIGAVDPDVILIRSNGAAVAAVVEELRMGANVHWIGGREQFLAVLDDVRRIKMGMPRKSQELFGFKSRSEVMECSRSEDGVDLRITTALVEKYGEDAIQKAIDETVEKRQGRSVCIHREQSQGAPMGLCSIDRRLSNQSEG